MEREKERDREQYIKETFCKLDYLTTDSEMKIVYKMLLSAPGEGRRQQQDWADGEVGLS